MTASTYLIVTIVVMGITAIVAFIFSYKFEKARYIEGGACALPPTEMQLLEDNLALFFEENNFDKDTALFEIADKLRVSFLDSRSEELTCVNLAKECAVELLNSAFYMERKKNFEDYVRYLQGIILIPTAVLLEELDKVNYIGMNGKQRIKKFNELCDEYLVEDVLLLRRINEVYAFRKFKESQERSDKNA